MPCRRAFVQGPGPILADNGIELADPVTGEMFLPDAGSPLLETDEGFLLFTGSETFASHQGG